MKNIFLALLLTGCALSPKEQADEASIMMFIEALGHRQIDRTPCEAVAWRSHASFLLSDPPYGTYRTWTHYQWALFEETCLAYYLMQQPKNHGILSSHVAPNFVKE